MSYESNEKGVKNHRLLSYYFENKILVHFKFDDGESVGIFQNGLVVDLSLEKLTCVLIEREEGEKPILLEHIQTESIEQFREVKE